MFHVGMSSAATIRAGRPFSAPQRTELRRGRWPPLPYPSASGALVVVLLLAVPGPDGRAVRRSRRGRPATRVIEIGISPGDAGGAVSSSSYSAQNSWRFFAVARACRTPMLRVGWPLVSYWLIASRGQLRALPYSLGGGPRGCGWGSTVGLLGRGGQPVGAFLAPVGAHRGLSGFDRIYIIRCTDRIYINFRSYSAASWPSSADSAFLRTRTERRSWHRQKQLRHGHVLEAGRRWPWMDLLVVT